MEAMRDLLNNIQPAPPPREDGDGEHEDQEPPEEFDWHCFNIAGRHFYGYTTSLLAPNFSQLSLLRLFRVGQVIWLHEKT